MLARKQLPPEYQAWNHRWNSPFGSSFWKRYFSERKWLWPGICELIGPFAFQSNNSTRAYEYPWAFFSAELEKSMRVIDLGAGFSGFPFVLSREGMRVTVVDPFVSYGPANHYVNPAKKIQQINKAFRTSVGLKQSTLEQSDLAEESIDRVFCISVLEHLTSLEQERTLTQIRKILKPGGRLLLTVDLFLDLHPFSMKKRNVYGENVCLDVLIQQSGLRLIAGRPDELYGFPEFCSENVMSNLAQYLIGTGYPALVQSLILEKS